jgi:hypothetical protein
LKYGGTPTIAPAHPSGPDITETFRTTGTRWWTVEALIELIWEVPPMDGSTRIAVTSRRPAVEIESPRRVAGGPESEDLPMPELRGGVIWLKIGSRLKETRSRDYPERSPHGHVTQQAIGRICDALRPERPLPRRKPGRPAHAVWPDSLLRRGVWVGYSRRETVDGSMVDAMRFVSARDSISTKMRLSPIIPDPPSIVKRATTCAQASLKTASS